MTLLHRQRHPFPGQRAEHPDLRHLEKTIDTGDTVLTLLVLNINLAGQTQQDFETLAKRRRCTDLSGAESPKYNDADFVRVRVMKVVSQLE